MQEDKTQGKDKKKKALILLLALLLVISTVGGIAVYSNRETDSQNQNVVALGEEKSIEDVQTPLAATPETEETGETEISDAVVPLAPAADETDSAPAAPATPTTPAAPAADADALAAELTELTAVMDTMLAAPTTPVATTGTVTTGGSTEGTSGTGSDPVDDEAARRAAEAARQEAEAKAARVADLQKKIDDLKEKLASAKNDTARIQEELLTARNTYETALEDANIALAEAKDKALAFYNMKYEGIAKLDQMITDKSKDENGNVNKVYEYFSNRNTKPQISLDSAGENFGVPVTETLKTELTATVDDTATTTDDTDTVTHTYGEYTEAVDVNGAANESGFRIYQNMKDGKAISYDIMWTEVDYSNLSAGTIIPVYHYNAQTGFLTLTTAQVAFKDGATTPYFTTGTVNPNGTGIDGTTLNVCLNPDNAFASAQEVTNLNATVYDESKMLGYNEKEIVEAQSNVNKEDGTATGEAQEALNRVVNQEVAAITEEKNVIDELNAAVGEMATETSVPVDQVNTDNGITTTETTPSAPVATSEEVAAAAPSE